MRGSSGPCSLTSLSIVPNPPAVSQLCHPGECGCEVASCCEQCPLPACRFDDNEAYQELWKRQQHTKWIEEIERYGLSISQAAIRFDVTERTISRIKARVKEARKVS